MSATRPEASDRSDPSDSPDRLLPRHGGYRKLHSYQTVLAVYDATLIFCDRFIDKRSRTRDQMVQAARSGVRNISEGSAASGTSKKTELKLTNVARASLEELLGDFEDFLRQRGLRKWDKERPEALVVRGAFRSDRSDMSDPSDPYGIRTATPDVAANTILCLINQASYLLRRQLERLEKDFLDHGGFAERLFAVRSRTREQRAADLSDGSNLSDRSDEAPACPRCSKPMRLRTARQGSRAGEPFWGCSAYPDCRGTRSADVPGPRGSARGIAS